MTDAANTSPTTDNRAAPPAAPRLSWATRLLLVLLLVGNLFSIAASVYLWRKADLANRANDDLQVALVLQNNEGKALKKKLDEQIATDTRFRQQTTDILKETSEKLRGLDRVDTSYWRIAEAEFLLKQAHQRLFITHDADTADLLLASADGAIMQQKDPGLLPVRSAIARDRAELRKVPRVDRDGIYLRLQELSSQVGMLTSDDRFLQANADAPEDGDNASNYPGQLLDRLLSVVRIRHHDHPVEPLLPPEQALYLRQNLQLALVQAQLGLLQSQQQTYATNLERAAAWVNQYCQTSDPVVDAWLQEARTLSRINIAPELPDISDSLRLVQKVIEQRAEEIRQALMLDDEEPADGSAEAPAAAEGTP